MIGRPFATSLSFSSSIWSSYLRIAGYVNSYLMKPVDELKKDLEQKAMELPSAFKKDGPDIVESE